MTEAMAGDERVELEKVDLDTALEELDEVLRLARVFVVHKLDNEVKELRQARFKLKHTLARRSRKQRDK